MWPHLKGYVKRNGQIHILQGRNLSKVRREGYSVVQNYKTCGLLDSVVQRFYGRGFKVEVIKIIKNIMHGIINITSALI